MTPEAELRDTIYRALRPTHAASRRPLEGRQRSRAIVRPIQAFFRSWLKLQRLRTRPPMGRAATSRTNHASVVGTCDADSGIIGP
mgnify:CR=1 FL=1